MHRLWNKLILITSRKTNPSPQQPRTEPVCPNPMPKITVSKAGVLNLLLKTFTWIRSHDQWNQAMCSGKTKVFWLTSKIKVTMLYKIRNDLIRISKKDLVPATSLRYRLNYAVPHSKLERHLHSFFPSSIRLWNRLPSEIKLSPDLLKFKSAVQNFQLTQPTSNHDFVFY